MKIGVFVGSFNPIHNGHKCVMDYLLNNDIVDKVLTIPTGNYWNKNNLIDVEYRAKMIKFYANENIIVDTKFANLQYTYQIFDELNKNFPNDEFYLIMGADNLARFYLWDNYQKILENKVIVLPRNDISLEEYIEKYKQKNNFVVLNDFEYIDISSTEIRKMINNNDLENLKKYMNENEIDFISKNGLYIG